MKKGGSLEPKTLDNLDSTAAAEAQGIVPPIQHSFENVAEIRTELVFLSGCTIEFAVGQSEEAGKLAGPKGERWNAIVRDALRARANRTAVDSNNLACALMWLPPKQDWKEAEEELAKAKADPKTLRTASDNLDRLGRLRRAARSTAAD